MPRWTWIVEADSEDRADRALTEAIAQALGEWEDVDATPDPISRSRIQALIEAGAVRVGGAAIAPHRKLKAGERVELDLPEPEPLELTPEAIPLEFLYQDEHIAVVNKPASLTVHPSSTQRTGTLVHALLHHLKDLSGVGGVQRPGIVHRLDKETSGALVVAKTDRAHQKLVETFAAHDIERRYWALVYGVPRNEGRIETQIGRNPNDRIRMSADVKGGRRAVTEVRVLERYGDGKSAPFGSCVEARLETGRTHQVRVHLTMLGSSVMGDGLYGVPSTQQPKWKSLPAEVRAAIERLSGQALHARVLGFAHPVTGQPLRFEAEPPEAFRLLHDALRKYR